MKCNVSTAQRRRRLPRNIAAAEKFKMHFLTPHHVGDDDDDDDVAAAAAAQHMYTIFFESGGMQPRISVNASIICEHRLHI